MAYLWYIYFPSPLSITRDCKLLKIRTLWYEHVFLSNFSSHINPVCSYLCQVANLRTSSMSSLNSQESSNDICKLTDKQQAEYRDAYREYIAQMAQLEMSGSGGERPVQPHPGQFLQAASSEDRGVGGQAQVHRQVFVTASLMPEDSSINLKYKFSQLLQNMWLISFNSLRCGFEGSLYVLQTVFKCCILSDLRNGRVKVSARKMEITASCIS